MNKSTDVVRSFDCLKRRILKLIVFLFLFWVSLKNFKFKNFKADRSLRQIYWSKFNASTVLDGREGSGGA